MPRAAVAAAAVFAVAVAAPAFADVGVSISVSQPGVYGRVDVGQYPQPQLVVQQPVIIARPPRAEPPPPPVYMWVPPAQRTHWSRYCGQYHACGAPVYFVQDGWYREHVRRDDHHDRGRGPGGDHGPRGRGHDDDRGHDH
jgi:hypothetical protein